MLTHADAETWGGIVPIFKPVVGVQGRALFQVKQLQFQRIPLIETYYPKLLVWQ